MVGGGVEVGEARRVVVAQQGQPFSGFHTSIAGAASNRVIVASHSVMVCIQGIGDFRRGRYPIGDLIDDGRYTIAVACIVHLSLLQPENKFRCYVLLAITARRASGRLETCNWCWSCMDERRAAPAPQRAKRQEYHQHAN
jgi:hypothetical protein